MACRRFWFGVLAAFLAAGAASAAEKGDAQLTSATNKSDAELTSTASVADGKALLVSAKGKVLVNQGTGFLQPSDGMSLKIGDKVFVGHKASALITYVADSCQVKVAADRVLMIEVLSPCQKNAVHIEPAADLPQEIPETAQAAEPEFPVVIPVVLIGGGIIACAIFCFDDDDHHKHTPD